MKRNRGTNLVSCFYLIPLTICKKDICEGIGILNYSERIMYLISFIHIGSRSKETYGLERVLPFSYGPQNFDSICYNDYSSLLMGHQASLGFLEDLRPYLCNPFPKKMYYFSTKNYIFQVFGAAIFYENAFTPLQHFP